MYSSSSYSGVVVLTHVEHYLVVGALIYWDTNLDVHEVSSQSLERLRCRYWKA